MSNITLNAGVGGATLGTDTVGGVEYQIAKLGHGAAGFLTLVSTASGLPVQQQGPWTVGLPSGASTAAKQPALGTAGSASADVLSVQGVASMTALKTDGSGVTQPVSGTFWQATQPVSGTFWQATQPVTNAGTFLVQAAESGTWTVQPGNTANTTPWLTSEQAAVAGGCSMYSFLSTAAVQAAQVKGSAGQVYGLQFFNNSATIAYGRLYDQTGAPASTDTANIKWRFLVPASTAGSGFVVPIPPGLVFGTGIGVRISAAVADNDTTALAANVVLGNVAYK